MNSSSAALPLGEAPALPRALAPALLAVALLAVAVLLGHALKPLLSRPVRLLRVDGALSHLSPAQVAAAAAIAPGTGLFDVDLAAARGRVEALPWVAHARVSREWPAGLAIRVTERQAAARWGADALVDTDGTVFTPAERPAGLPQLSGPPARAAEVERVYGELAAALKDSPFVPAGLDLSARGEWTLHTAGGTELRLGQAPQARVELMRGAVARTLGGRLQQVAYVDLRYTNGFAVGPAAPAVVPANHAPAARVRRAGPGAAARPAAAAVTGGSRQP